MYSFNFKNGLALFIDIVNHRGGRLILALSHCSSQIGALSHLFQVQHEVKDHDLEITLQNFLSLQLFQCFPLILKLFGFSYGRFWIFISASFRLLTWLFTLGCLLFWSIFSAFFCLIVSCSFLIGINHRLDSLHVTHVRLLFILTRLQ